MSSPTVATKVAGGLSTSGNRLDSGNSQDDNGHVAEVVLLSGTNPSHQETTELQEEEETKLQLEPTQHSNNLVAPSTFPPDIPLPSPPIARRWVETCDDSISPTLANRNVSLQWSVESGVRGQDAVEAFRCVVVRTTRAKPLWPLRVRHERSGVERSGV